MGRVPGIYDAIGVGRGRSPGTKLANGKEDLWHDSGRGWSYCGRQGSYKQVNANGGDPVGYPSWQEDNGNIAGAKEATAD